MELNFPALYLETTRLCNLHCPGCMTGSNDSAWVKAMRSRELKFDEIRDLVLAPARRLGVKAVGWSGGEFLLRKDAMQLLELGRELGYQAKVLSNCELLTRERLVSLKEATGGQLTIAVGLDSIEEENTESRKVVPDRTLEVLKLCDELKIDRHVIITISKRNTKSFERTVEYLVARRISYNRSPFAGRGSGRASFHQYAFDRVELQECFHSSLRRHVNGYVSFTPFFLSPELHAEVSGGIRNGTVPHNPPIGCWVGTWLTVNAEGDVSVCPVLLDSLKGGNVREKPLDVLVHESPLFADLLDRSKLKGKCSHCRYQYTCGGCRAMAYYHTGDYLAADPTCFFNPVDRTTVSEHEEETNRMFKKYLMIARYVGLYERPQKPGREQATAANGAANGNGSAPAESGDTLRDSARDPGQ